MVFHKKFELMLTRHAKAYSSHSCDENAFNIVAVLVSRNTSLARPRTWLVKAKDLILKAKDSKFVLEDTPRPRTTTLLARLYLWHIMTSALHHD